VLKRWFAGLALCVLAAPFAPGQQGSPAPAAVAASTPAAPSVAHNRLSLDVVVSDNAGKAVAGLEPFDFTLLDNNQPRKILNFRRTDGAAGSKFDPPVEVIIVLDAVNLPYQAVTLQRLEVDKYLRQNGGKLPQPTSVFIFSSQGLHVQPEPSKDGNAMAATLDQSNGLMRARGAAGDVYGMAEQFQSSIETMTGIAENEAHKPGRKLLLWLGPGWPLLEDRRFIETNESREHYFHTIVALANKLREARVTVYGLFTIVGVTSRGQWTGYTKPVREPRKTETGNLALQVMAEQTGGRVIDPGNDVSGEIEACLADASQYYTLTFEAPPAEQADEYHELKVQVSQPGLSVRTNTGYYGQR
jgi:VWFA-related protein